ncbi:hypothetical protein [Ligilactobacillus apodemi]|uniref:hypothetical protein n=1 Tax=Ligilactobacillus apodemi TaxID=307126 RepID=UPI00046881A0|nr:hypothetical protein [Ligilactobacillus apodemi]
MFSTKKTTTHKFYLAFLGFIIFTILASVSAGAVTVTKSFWYDKNKVTGVTSNYRKYQKANIPSWSKFTGSKTTHVNSGWNFNTYERVNYYSGGY